ncbi:SspB family protein [Gymnodinialimonas ulvae]|uniref:SspB family protein n=1 Tax=Gymnodinialimonas ulvae TaxID=3126504 RepID=UPI0030B018FC
MPSSIPYGRLMHEAVCGVIRQVLRGVAASGLPGDHHFFITFNTRHDAVDIADWLRDRYPEEMMIVIQNWYDDLQVDDDQFAVTLNFGDAPERLTVPFDAILTFVDPSVEFGWRFERNEEGDTDGTVADTDPDTADAPDTPDTPDAEPDASDPGDTQKADVVSLDTFRKNT